MSKEKKSQEESVTKRVAAIEIMRETKKAQTLAIAASVGSLIIPLAWLFDTTVGSLFTIAGFAPALYMAYKWKKLNEYLKAKYNL